MTTGGLLTDLVGYLATLVFLGSYLLKRQTSLRRTQAVAAGLWSLYGVLINAMPVIVANLLVVGIAVWSSWKVPENL